MSVEDYELDREAAAMPPGRPSQAGTPRAWIIGGLIVLAIIIGGLARWWTMNREEPAVVATEPETAPTPIAEAEPPPVVLPPLDEMDPFLRGLLGALSVRPELARWLATEGLINQMALAVDRLSRGGSPASDLRVLAPTGPFVAQGRTVRTVDPASYRRYDGLAETLAGMDPAAVAQAYKTIHPRLDEAYRNLGRTETDVDVAVQRALDVLIATPIPEGPVRVVEGRGNTWAYADPRLERLDPAQKQLLRLGPDNAARVIEVLKDVQRQLRS